jgi:hypothetical protein
MSQNQKKQRDKSATESWEYLKENPEQPKGPAKPWSDDLNQAADEFVNFLQDSESKKAVKDFIIDTYKKFESERLAKIQARMEHEKKVNSRGATEYHRPGNIAPMLHDELNMTEIEHAFAHSLKTTKNNLVRSVEERVGDIQRLLADIGGFSAQLKSSFARSTVVFLEQEDPKFPFRERLIFSINLPNYELKKPWVHERTIKKTSREGGRTSLQVTWDEAVNALAKIVEHTGLKPKYCKNDRHYGRFVMKQDLRSTTFIPDEYFSFTLDYHTENKIQEMRIPYEKTLESYEKRINVLEKKLAQYPENSKAPRYTALKNKYLHLCQDRDFFVGTTPDPNQLDEGLLFLIEVSTLKDYHIVKDRMQSIMTRYILYLSKIAEKDLKNDSEYEVQMQKLSSKNYAQSEETEFKDLSAEELKDLPEYSIDSRFLKRVETEDQNSVRQPPPMRKKKAA